MDKSREGLVYPWILNPGDDGMLFIREERGDDEMWPVVLADIPGGWGGGFGQFPHDMAIVEYLVQCRNEAEGVGDEPSSAVLIERERAARLAERAGCTNSGCFKDDHTSPCPIALAATIRQGIS